MNSSLKKRNRVSSADMNMVIFLLGKTVSLFGTRIMNFAIGLYILKITGSGMSFALTMIISTIPAILISPFAGVLADRLDRKKVVVITDVLCGIVLMGAYFLAIRFSISLSLVLVMVFLLSIFNTFFNITMEASIPNIVDSSRLTKINSFSSSITSLASIAGPALGGFIYGFVPIEMFLMLASISFILSAISETFINFNFNNIPHKKKAKENILEEVKSGFIYVKKQNIIFTILICSVFINFIFSGFTVSLPYIINVQLGLHSEQYGLIQSLLAVGSLIFSLVYSKFSENMKKYKYVIVAFVLVSILTILTGIPTISFFPSFSQIPLLIYYMLINFSIGGALVFINLPAFILIQKETSEEYRGRVNGILGTMSLSIQPIGMIIGGYLVDRISAFLLMFLFGILFLTMAFFFIRIKGLKEVI